jgi:hypothetical protein
MIKLNSFILIFLFCMFLCSCDYFRPSQAPKAVARVNNTFLFQNDLENVVPEGLKGEDSLLIVNSFIERWATQELLLQTAELNLTEDQKRSFNELLLQYKNDLYTKAYLEEMVQSSIDTTLFENDLKAYYLANKENFRTTGALVKLSYINLPQDHPKLALIQKKFYEKKKKSDDKFWNQYQLQFKNFAMNDTIWVEMNQVYRKLPFITPENRNQFIMNGKAFQEKDSLDLYIVKIKDVLEKNEIAPFEYIKPTIKQVLLNKRKLEFIKKFENEMVQDAKNNNKYEIYEK